MSDLDDDFFDTPDDLPPSKSQLKREMTALQELGAELLKLSDKQLLSFPLSDELREALADYKRFKKNEAKRRQMQFIGKLMRSEETEAIQARFEEIDAENQAVIHKHHRLEELRDQLLEKDNQQAFDRLLKQCPDVDIQHVRQLIRGAQKELATGKPPSSARKLFRYLRDFID